jgi:DNA (cytosine-5)-methyltransferase 1
MNLKCVDLFSGAGGLSLGFKNANFDIIIHCEYIDSFAKTYKHNIGCKKNIKDITQSDPHSVMEEYSINPEDIDIIIGGPPCQGFSSANTSKNFIIQKHNQLVKHYIKYIEAFRPKSFVMENVPNMLSKEFKFYRTISPDELEDLRKINIIPIEETLIIGNSAHAAQLSKELNILNAQRKCAVSIGLIVDDAEVVISKDSYNNKLCIILDKINDLVAYLSAEHPFGLDEVTGYEKKINVSKLKKTRNILNTSTKNKITSLVEIIKVQLEQLQKSDVSKEIDRLWLDFMNYEELLKVMLHYNELIENEIQFTELIPDSNGSIATTVYSYNIVDYCEAKFKNLGYLCSKNILNAANYGVPQLRNRLVFVGVLPECLSSQIKEQINEISTSPLLLEAAISSNLDINAYLLNSLVDEEKKKLLFPDIILNNDQFVNLGSALSDLYEVPPASDINHYTPHPSAGENIESEYQRLMREGSDYFYNHINTSSHKEIIERFGLIGVGKNYKDVLSHLEKDYDKVNNTHSTIYLRPDPTQPAKTVPNIRKSMWIHPKYNRALSIREAARLQSFPDTFEFFGTKDQQYQQIGNAVPPLMAQAIAEKVKYLLTGQYNEEYKNQIKKLAPRKEKSQS